VIARLGALCVRHKRAVVALALAAAVAGEVSRRHLAKDALPDIADPRVVLVSEWMGHPADDVSARITDVLTAVLGDVPESVAVRGTSMAGMGFIDVVFRAGADLAAGRAEVRRRVDRARGRLPTDALVTVGPEASSTGWVFQYALIDRRGVRPLRELFVLQEDVLRPALGAVPGVAEVASFGGGAEQLAVTVDRTRLEAAGVAMMELASSVRSALRGARPPSPGDVEAALVRPAGAGGGPVRIGDVARVRRVPDLPIGLADLGGRLPAIGGIVVARHGADPGAVVAGVKAALARARPRLPAGTEIVPVVDRADLAARVEGTLLRALAEEIAVVVAVVLLFLLDGRSALVPLLTLPLVLALTFAGMRLVGVSATVMSFGGIGIALGMAVDADLIALEACHRAIAYPPGGVAPDRRARLAAAAASFTPAVLTSLLIAALSFLPMLAFSGETGRLLAPLVLGKTLVIAAAALVTMTVAPVVRERLLPRRARGELANPLTRALCRAYRPFVELALRRPLATLLIAAFAILSCLPLLPLLGGEFFPRVDEGDLLFMPTTAPGVMPGEAAAELREQDRILSRFRETDAVLGKVGRADTATDPAPFSMVETTIHLKPRGEWPTRQRLRWYSRFAPWWARRLLGHVWPETRPATTEELVAEMNAATRLRGWTNAWTSPVRARIDMMASGVRTPVGVRVAGASLARGETLAAAVRTVLERVPGTRSAVSEPQGGESWLSFVPDAAALARHGVDADAVREAAELVVADGLVGVIPAPGGGRGLPVRLALDPTPSRAVDRLLETTVRSGGGSPAPAAPVPLGLLGRAAFVRRPAVVRSERGEAVAYVDVDLDSGTDIVGYLARARREVASATAAGVLSLRPGERIEWTGQSDLLAAGQRRLTLIVPLVVLSMLALLYLQFRSLTEALVVLSAVPFALVGSFWTLFLLDYPLSAPVWVGLLSVVGLAMQTGVVMVVYIDQAFHRRVREGRIASRDDIVAAHAEGCVQRLRPKLMTVTTMAAGLLPLLWADGAGAEILKRVAAPMLGGLVSSAFLTLEVLPVLYTLWRHRQLRRAARAGRPLAEILGPAPPWARA
jgi:Cu(I)/Ag(I) efflux system membrane protein CusA/SilA